MSFRTASTRLTLALAAIALPVLASPAAAQPGAGAVYNGRLGQTTVPAVRADTSVEIDGALDEAVWSRAARLTGFSLYQPSDGRPAPDSTEVLVWYSATAIHFGIRAFEPHGAARATLADRDRIGGDDNVEIQLDTYDDKRHAFVFIVNPLGVQADGTKNEGGGFIPGSNVAPGQNDLSADFQWDSRGRVTPWGYEVEVRIPFSSLRFPDGGTQRWGIQVDRHVQHNGYEATWTPARRASASFIAQYGALTGLTGMHHGQVVEVIPELTSTTRGSSGTAAGDWRYTSDQQLGGNVRWTLGSNFVLNGTAKPDFSQIEADATQIASDPRFALFYPERRPFFVEGSEQFNVANTLVYTRRIVQPDAAVKLTGRVARTDVAVLGARDAGLTTPDGERPLVGIARLQRGFGAQNTAGLLYSGRSGGGRSNQVAGGDVRIVFGRLYFAQLQAVASATRQDGPTRTAPMWEAVVDRTGRRFGFHYNVLGIADDFRADNGFVPRVGFVKPNAFNRVTFYGAPGALVEQYSARLMTYGLWRYDDFFAGRDRLEDRVSLENQFTLRGGWTVNVAPLRQSFAFDSASYGGLFVAPVGAGDTTAFVPSGRIGTAGANVQVQTPQYRHATASLGTFVGNDVDFGETSRVRRRDWNASLDLRPNERLRLTATWLSTAFLRRSDGSRSAATRIPRLKLEYQLARPIFVRLVTQYQATERDALRDPRSGTVILVRNRDGSITPSVATASNALRADWLFSFRPNPGSVFFAGYGSTLTEPDPLAFRDLRRSGDGFFLKASYLLRGIW